MSSLSRPEVDCKAKVDELFHQFINDPAVLEKLKWAHELALRGIDPNTVDPVNKNDQEQAAPKKSPRPPSPIASPRPKRSGSSSSIEQKSSSSPTNNGRSKREDRIPKFFFPNGKPLDQELDPCRLFPEKSGSLSEIEYFCERARMPRCWRILIPYAIHREQGVKLFNDKHLYIGQVHKKNLTVLWQNIKMFTDEYAMFVRLVDGGSIIRLNSVGLKLLVLDLINISPSLSHLKTSPDFHIPYARAVIERLGFAAHAWTNTLTKQMIKSSKFLEALEFVSYHENDVNNEPHFFSYEHFYVIYCEYYELDTRQKGCLTPSQLARYAGGTVNPMVFKRICKTTNRYRRDGIEFADFIWFILSEEDKSHPTAIEYWFRILDFDGDGLITMYDLQQFYYEQTFRIEHKEEGDFLFENKLDEILDRLGAAIGEDPNQLARGVKLSHLKRAKDATQPIIDTFISLDKYIESEEDPKPTDVESPWQVFVGIKYRELMDEDSEDKY